MYIITYFNLKVVGKYIWLCIEYILLFRLIIYSLYSSTCSFSTFYLGLLFTCTAAWVNTLSNLISIVYCPYHCIRSKQATTPNLSSESLNIWALAKINVVRFNFFLNTQVNTHTHKLNLAK